MQKPKDFEKSKIFTEFEVLNTKPLTIKIPLKQNTFGTVNKIGGRWDLEFDSSSHMKLQKPLQVFDNKDYISINAADAGEVIEVKDEFYGEEFKVIPLSNAGDAIAKLTAKREVIFEPSLQGVVFREINEYADIKSTKAV